MGHKKWGFKKNKKYFFINIENKKLFVHDRSTIFPSNWLQNPYCLYERSNVESDGYSVQFLVIKYYILKSCIECFSRRFILVMKKNSWKKYSSDFLLSPEDKGLYKCQIDFRHQDSNPFFFLFLNSRTLHIYYTRAVQGCLFY